MYTEREINLQDAAMHQRLIDFLAGFILTIPWGSLTVTA